MPLRAARHGGNGNDEDQAGFLGVLVGTTALWLLADTFFPQPFGYFPFRRVFNQYSGIVSMGAMSLCMILAVRPVWLEDWLNGLDKGYRLHKWLGIVALVSALAHFWFAKGTKWMVGWGWLTRPERPRRPQGAGAETVQSIEQWLRGFRGLAEDVGEWAFYIAVALMVVSLVKRIPYRWFVRTHKWLAVGYLALVFHSVVLMKFAYWMQPVGWLMALLMAAGVLAAALVLMNRVGRARRSVATVAAVTRCPELDSYELLLDAPAWGGHRAGQFVFLRSLRDKESAHPYTIASAWDARTPRLRLLVKNLGDYTARLVEHFRAGDAVSLEGPYGRFTFADDAPAQIWVAGGIGITPFLAWLEELAQQREGARPQTVDLFYCYRNAEPHWLAQLQRDAQRAGVTLHLWCTAQQSRLTGERLCEHAAHIADWQQASVWFCGRADFGEALRRDLRACGLPSARFHQELFEMR